MRCQPWLKALVYKCTNINQACLLCDALTDQPYALCACCELELPWLDDQCRICALPLPMRDLTCGQCRRKRPAFKQVQALWHYGFPVDALITRFKHNRQWPLGRLLAELQSNSLQNRFEQGLPRPDLLLPVPMARGRLRQRGFNQAAMLARWLSAHLHIPCDEQSLQRPHESRAQQALGAKDRQRNLREAFTLGRTAALEGLHLALVDDVMTTGATAQAVASLLRQAGASRVDVYCLARTPKPDKA